MSKPESSNANSALLGRRICSSELAWMLILDGSKKAALTHAVEVRQISCFNHVKINEASRQREFVDLIQM